MDFFLVFWRSKDVRKFNLMKFFFKQAAISFLLSLLFKDLMILLKGLLINNFLLSKEYCKDLTFYMIFISSAPSNGGAAVTKMYRITPNDQISHF